MDIDVNNVDMAYEQCSELNKNMLNNGSELMNSLNLNIASLKRNWIASDATAHINKLIELYNSMDNLISQSLMITSTAANSIISIQNVRRINHSGVGNVGTPLQNQIEFPRIAPAVETSMYQVNQAALTSDLNTLIDIREKYDQFVSTFKTQRTELDANWKNGANRQLATQVFDEFVNNNTKYRSYLENAIENLTTATSNVGTIVS